MIEQVLECVGFDDLAILDDSEPRTLLDGRETMSDHDGSTSLHDALEGFLDQPLRGLIQSTCCFVKKKDARLADNGPSNSDALLLATRKLAATVSSEHVEALMQSSLSFLL